ncbi:MAG: hypothetical protein U0746_18330 [Gemmataceae bacterium]
MRSPALALTGHVWLRYRWGLAACVAAWLATVAVVLVVPRSVWTAGPEDGPLLPVHFLTIIGTFVPVLAFVICAFAFTDGGPIESRESPFPPRAFLLPLPTSTLVFWPMAQAAAMTGTLWIAWAVGVLRPAGLDVPLAWPAVLLATVTAWLQAALWMPYPLPMLRVAALPLVAAIGLVPALLIVAEVRPAGVAAGILPLLPAAYFAAIVGVRAARCGKTPEWAWPGRVWRAAVARMPRRRKDFGSAVEAQAWFEWRLRGWALPFTAALMAVAWVPTSALWVRAVEQMSAPDVTPTLTSAAEALSPPGLLLAITLAFLPLYAGALGTDMGGVRTIGQRIPPLMSGCHPLIALRPLSNTQLIAAKLRMAARSTVVAWAILLSVVVATFTWTDKWATIASAPAFRHHGATFGLLLTAVIVGAIAATWLHMISGFWIGLTGSGWFITSAGLAVALGWIPLGLTAGWLWTQPAWWALLPSIIATICAVKLLIAIVLGRRLVQCGQLRLGAIVAGTIVWLALVITYVGLSRWAIPADRATLATIAQVVTILVPLNQIMAMPLALAWNRSR